MTTPSNPREGNAAVPQASETQDTRSPAVGEALERLEHELLITSEPDSGFAKDIRTVCDALRATLPVPSRTEDQGQAAARLVRTRLETLADDLPEVGQILRAEARDVESVLLELLTSSSPTGTAEGQRESLVKVVEEKAMEAMQANSAAPASTQEEET